MKHLFVISSALLISTTLISTTALAYPIAGTTPDQRPESAPVIKEFAKSTEWYQQALQGVGEPYPASLRFLEDQGAWYTPFNHKGMTGPYDIRNWHK